MLVCDCETRYGYLSKFYFFFWESLRVVGSTVSLIALGTLLWLGVGS